MTQPSLNEKQLAELAEMLELDGWLPQVGKPFRQSPTEGNPPAALAHHGTSLPKLLNKKLKICVS